MPYLPIEEESSSSFCCLSNLFSRQKKPSTSISADDNLFPPHTYSSIPSMDKLPAYEDCVSEVNIYI